MSFKKILIVVYFPHPIACLWAEFWELKQKKRTQPAAMLLLCIPKRPFGDEKGAVSLAFVDPAAIRAAGFSAFLI